MNEQDCDLLGYSSLSKRRSEETPIRFRPSERSLWFTLINYGKRPEYSVQGTRRYFSPSNDNKYMALGDFFRINMPYGMKRNDKNEWFVFNREYKPLGWNTGEFIEEEKYPVYVKYKSLTNTQILKLAGPDQDSIKWDQNGGVYMFWLYSDNTNPKDSPRFWNDYFEKIKILAKLKAENP